MSNSFRKGSTRNNAQEAFLCQSGSRDHVQLFHQSTRVRNYLGGDDTTAQ
jgi:hypothetical protein